MLGCFFETVKIARFQARFDRLEASQLLVDDLTLKVGLFQLSQKCLLIHTSLEETATIKFHKEHHILALGHGLLHFLGEFSGKVEGPMP